ncbi:MAG TPA: TlpA disulfide reductase family protein [Pirellulales bacterium]|jgi:thiol-disulfide isomerase/thioredoxin|nr:TlpA disulfide reductase family protein [Pirellulales bacterium]
MKSNALLALAFLVSSNYLHAAPMQDVHGIVLDEQGRPAANIDVCGYWGANGPFWDKDGKQVDFSNQATRDEYFGPKRLGRMDPGLKEVARTDAKGEFHFEVPDYLHTLMVMDTERIRGGLATLPKDPSTAPVEVRLAPMTRVRASFEGPGAGETPSWTHTYIQTPYDPTRPLDVTRLVGCSSDYAKLLVSLPPGRYFIDAYNRGETSPTARLSNKEFVVSAGQKELDLGVLQMPAAKDRDARFRESKAAGRWGDYKKHYGRKPPAWFANEARGISKDVSVADFKGRWVLIEFWNMNCAPCLKRSLPELMKFYETHSGQRDKFEIVSIFLDPDEEYASLADVDRAIEPIVEHVWGGKTIQFPILLDSSFRTWESFGLPGMGTIVLIDPQGNLVPGSLPELAKQLDN